jgi:xylulokinase
MRNVGVEVRTVRAGDANMFLSPLFGEAFATVTQSVVELYNTDGSQGAARGAGIGAGIYPSAEEAFVGLNPIKTVEPDEKLAPAYKQAYKKWESILRDAQES